MEVTKEQIEIEEQAQPESVVEELPTREEMKSKGWSKEELDKAEERGMLRKEKEPEKKTEVKQEETPKDEEVSKPQEKEQEKPDRRPKNIPDFNLSPEQEKYFNEVFPPGTNVRGLYHRMKNERQSRQRLESELAEMRAKIDVLEKQPPREIDQEVDEDGNPIDPDNKPLTMKQLREMREKEEKELRERREKETAKARLVQEAQQNQEEYARSVYPDFDDTVNYAKDVMQNLNTLIPEKWKQEKVIKLVQDLQVTAARADELGIDDYNAAFIAYEIGQYHPDFNKQKKATGQESEIDGNPKDPKANGGLTPEQMKRIENNTQRRASSASIPGGGGKRTISVEDITASDIVKMTALQRQNFKEKHPDIYARIIRG